MTIKMTDPWVKNITKQGLHWDSVATGLGLKVGDKGRKTWLMQLVWPGQTSQSRRTMGRYPGLSLADARTKAQQWYDLAKGGRDPKAVEADQAAEVRREALNTFEKVAEAYAATKQGRRADRDAKLIRFHLVKAWGARPVASITPRDVRDVLGALAKRAPYAANQLWSHASQLFRFAVHEELIETSPMASLAKRLTLNGAKLEHRKRTLTDAELRALWRITGDMDSPEGDCYRLLMLTGCRRSEAAEAQWPEFDLGKAALWTIPPERNGNKSGEVRLVPLSKNVVALLKKRSAAAVGPFVFTNDGERAINGFSKLKAAIDKKMGDDVPGWVNHDIRRTVRTHLAALGIEDHVAELVIGHGRRGLQRVYDQHKYVSEMRAALDAWAKKLAALVR